MTERNNQEITGVVRLNFSLCDIDIVFGNFDFFIKRGKPVKNGVYFGDRSEVAVEMALHTDSFDLTPKTVDVFNNVEVAILMDNICTSGTQNGIVVDE